MKKTSPKCSLHSVDDHDSNQSLSSLNSESPKFISSSHMFTWQQLQLLSDSQQHQNQPFNEEPINPLFFQQAQQALELFHSIKNQNTLVPPPKGQIPTLGQHPPALLLGQSGIQQSSSSLPFQNTLLSPCVKLQNLKQISALVFKQFLKQQYLTYSNLFKRLGVDDGQMRTRNNLKRRMYDVINVLSAAGFVRKQNCSLRRIQPLRSESQLPQILKQQAETKKRIQIKKMLKMDCLYKVLVLSKIKNQNLAQEKRHETMTKMYDCQNPQIPLPFCAIVCNNTMTVQKIKTNKINDQVSVHIDDRLFELIGDTKMIQVKLKENTKAIKMLVNTKLKI